MGAALLGGRSQANVYRGLEGIRRWKAEIDEVFVDPRFELIELREAGEKVLEIMRLTARGRESGVPVELDGARVWEFRDGKVWRAQAYLDRREALRAAGLEGD